MGGKSLDESASIQEISEQILYYHRDQKWSHTSSSDPPTPRTKNTWTEEAVQFLGLCSALYTLPSSLGGDDFCQEKTKQIYFGKSTLVFVPLESSPNLLAVAQISRLYQQGSKSENGGGNPLAIRASIERCHALFCLLRGGGILSRLEASTQLMGDLYRLLRNTRKVKEQFLKSGSTLTVEDEEKFDNRLAELQDEVQSLRKRLPIQSIRRDLDFHYKEYLAHQGLAMTRNGGAGRCLVETIPEPIARHNGTHTLYGLWNQSSPFLIEFLDFSTRRLIEELAAGTDQKLSLLGISTFFDGHLVKAHWSNVSIFTRLDDGCNLPGLIVAPKEQVHILMSHMASYSVRMSQIPSARQESTAVYSQLGIKNIAMSFGESASSYSSPRSDTNSDVSHIFGQFVPPPPPFMLNAIEEPWSIDILNQRKAWALKVYLPVRFSSDQLTKEISYRVHAVVYEVERYSFLLFFDARHNVDLSQELLLVESRLNDIVSKCEDKAKDVGSNVHDDPQRSRWTEPGQDILVISRKQNQLYLFSDHKQPVRKDRRKPSSKSPPRRFLGFMTKSHSSSGEGERSRAQQIEWTTLGLDCRHFLASHLHLDTILAFDDMMNEIAKRKKKESTGRMDAEGDDSVRRDIVELCTCMPLGWIYACATETIELYAFFDSSIYVTVADVQSAATRIQERFIAKQQGAES